jgi:hypothetical protein
MILKNLSSAHRATLVQVFDDPPRASIAWRDVEALLIACGAERSEGSGSRMRFALNGVRAVFQQPHPKKEIDKGALKSVRRFLGEAGIRP